MHNDVDLREGLPNRLRVSDVAPLKFCFSVDRPRFPIAMDLGQQGVEDAHPIATFH